jgi:pimeloyl-ACP methyl ester carboxylesterase
MKRILSIPFLLLFLLTNCTPANQNPTSSISPTKTPVETVTEKPTGLPMDTTTILDELDAYPCPDSAFTCVDLQVPLDHFNPGTDETIQVVFGVLPASGESKGMFVTATGGPGYAGLASADDYTSYFDPSILENFDIVFFDQRGTGQSDGMQCVNAAVAFYRADWQTDTPIHQADFSNTAETFALDCVQEMGLPVEDLPYYSTRQAVEDLEIFRQAMGSQLMWLYGESYGTQYAQTYAEVHPEGLGGMILDGTVDLTLSGPDYYIGAANSFFNTLVDSLNACSVDESCGPDLGGEALSYYQTLSAEILASPQKVNFPLPSGELESRLFSFSDLEYVVSSEVYTEGSRLILLRALASARQGDLVPLLRLLYIDLGLDSQTLEPIPYPDYSDAAYYTITCDDYSYYSGTPAERAQAMFTDGQTLASSVPYLSSIFYGDIPCLFWPVQGETERPAALTAQGIPTLVLGATADPITPVQYGEAVFSRLADGYLITTQGGAHVTFGRGNACPDEIVTAFLVDGKTPAERRTSCDGVLYNSYVPLSSTDLAAYADPLEAMIAVDTEIYYLPEYYYWDVLTATSVGCPYSGTLLFEATDTGEAYTLDQCAFINGFSLSGTGSYDYETSLFILEVTVSGAGTGTLSYLRDDNQGIYTLTGDYNGTQVELTK